MNATNKIQLVQIIEKLIGSVNSIEDNNAPYVLYYKNNPNGSLRWVWPADVPKPMFLKFYNTATFRAKCIAFAIRIVFVLRLQKFFSSGITVLPIATNNKQVLLNKLGQHWALFAGTQGETQTALVYSASKKLFFKIPIVNTAANCLAAEISNLSYIHTLELNSVKTPYHCIENKEVLQLEDLSTMGMRSPLLTNTHWLFLSEIASKTTAYKKIAQTDFWYETQTLIKALKSNTDSRIPKGLLRKLDLLIQTVDTSVKIPISYAHGDFTPWNMYVTADKLMLYDFEMGKLKMPALFDAFHFMYQQEALAGQNNNKRLLAAIQSALRNATAASMINNNGIDVNLHHKLYLLYTTGYFLNQYAQQPSWQVQFRKSIQGWTMAANNLISESNTIQQRQLLLNDFFDFLMPKKYAALKWFDANPEFLDTYSDVDLCVEKSDIGSIRKFLRSHSLVKKVEVKGKSCMVQYYITLTDESYLCIDCIWSFKRKNTVMFNASKLLKNTVVNCAGVKIPAIQYDFYYTWLFYTLNNAEIPEKYKEYYIRFGTILNTVLETDFKKLPHLKLLLNDVVCSKNAASVEINSLTYNKGISKVFNTLNYVIDALREVSFKRGFIVTFSGVDGAGKSTVIDNLKHELEKKYRRKVVVLRHRPALLPMLSAWKEGSRQAAELKAANTLPRQGTNKSIASSLVRFGYYYADYLIGQFYVYAKYVLTGHIVLYDRYYFDFINDSRRSNIMLPKALISAGYIFLLKPRFNFFLYADENTIRLRKQELDTDTIKILTKKYLKLFTGLSKLPGKQVYMPIENIKLSTTINVIDNQLKTAVI